MRRKQRVIAAILLSVSALFRLVGPWRGRLATGVGAGKRRTYKRLCTARSTRPRLMYTETTRCLAT